MFSVVSLEKKQINGKIYTYRYNYTVYEEISFCEWLKISLSDY